MAKARHINIVEFTKLQTVIFLSIGALCGILYSFGGLIIDTLVSLGMLSPESMGTPGLSYGTILAFGALIGIPLIFGVGKLGVKLILLFCSMRRGTVIITLSAS